MDFTQRRQFVRDNFEELGIDAFIASNPVHVRYLSGFTGSNGALALTEHEQILLTDGRYIIQASLESPDCTVLIERNVVLEGVQAALKTGAKRIGVEGDSLTHSVFLELADIVVEKNAVLVSVSGMVERSRMVKDDDEIAALTQACLITDRAWETTISEGVIGKTESEIAGIVEMYFRKFGAEDRAFESIVASGPHSAIPHHHPTDRVIQRGDFLKMDIGAKFAGYHADMTRTVVIGSATDWQREIYDWVKLAQQTAMNACVPGADVFPINGIGHGVVADAGYGDKLVHQIGHGVGLEIHEKPFLGRQDGILRPRMPITVEPGIYLEGRGGVRIEDTILITDSGYRRLTESTRDLLEI